MLTSRVVGVAVAVAVLGGCSTAAGDAGASGSSAAGADTAEHAERPDHAEAVPVLDADAINSRLTSVTVRGDAASVLAAVEEPQWISVVSEEAGRTQFVLAHSTPPQTRERILDALPDPVVGEVTWSAVTWKAPIRLDAPMLTGQASAGRKFTPAAAAELDQLLGSGWAVSLGRDGLLAVEFTSDERLPAATLAKVRAVIAEQTGAAGGQVRQLPGTRVTRAFGQD